MPLLFWILPLGLLTFALVVLLRRRVELGQYRHSLAERSLARSRGSHQARLQHPVIDLSRCIGCGACVRACPEDGVLGLAYGQAMVVHGARCVGHGRCADACPTAAISLTLGDLRGRNDLPAIDERLQAVTVPGLFLAGEVTGFALVRTAVQHGAQVAREVAGRVAASQSGPATVLAQRHRSAAGSHSGSSGGTATAIAASTAAQEPLDLLIVGMGPAGLACALAGAANSARWCRTTASRPTARCATKAPLGGRCAPTSSSITNNGPACRCTVHTPPPVASCATTTAVRSRSSPRAAAAVATSIRTRRNSATTAPPAMARPTGDRPPRSPCTIARAFRWSARTRRPRALPAIRARRSATSRAPAPTARIAMPAICRAQLRQTTPRTAGPATANAATRHCRSRRPGSTMPRASRWCRDMAADAAPIAMPTARSLDCRPRALRATTTTTPRCATRSTSPRCSRPPARTAIRSPRSAAPVTSTRRTSRSTAATRSRVHAATRPPAHMPD